MCENENVHPNLFFLSPPNRKTDKSAIVMSVSPAPRISILSSRMSNCSIMDEGYVTASESAMSVSPKRTRNRKNIENDINNNLQGVSQLQDELLQLREQILHRDEEIEGLMKKYESLLAHADIVENERDMMKAELDMHNFIIGIQTQKINELENQVSSSRLEYHEAITSKNKKMKQLTQKLDKEKAEHEKRANSMIGQLNEQMVALQKMALTRIETLEKELMKERHKVQSLQTENEELKLENDDRKWFVI